MYSVTYLIIFRNIIDIQGIILKIRPAFLKSLKNDKIIDNIPKFPKYKKS